MQHKKIVSVIHRIKNVIADLFTTGDVTVFFFGKNLINQLETSLFHRFMTVQRQSIPHGIQFLLPSRLSFSVKMKVIRVNGKSTPIHLSIFPSLLLLSIVYLMLWLSVSDLYRAVVHNNISEPAQQFLLPVFLCLLSVWILYSLFGREMVIFTKRRVGIGTQLFGIRLGTTWYDFLHLETLQIASYESTKHGMFMFEISRHLFGKDWPRTIRYGKTLTEDTAPELLTQWRDIIKFHCHTVEKVVFGGSPFPDSEFTIYNPDVNDWSVPCVHLKQIVIHADTYPFHRLEQFLTYAVNSLGQAYLKATVDVVVYGGGSKILHPNIRNNLLCLCHRVKTVSIHDEQSGFSSNTLKESMGEGKM